jgi:proteasome accessory factor A
MPDGSDEEVSSATDWGRKFLPQNGGSFYIDSDHLEMALPETASAYDHVAYWRGMLGIARGAMTALNRRLPPGCCTQVLANCSDGLGHSYGSHANVLLARSAWNDIFERRPHYLSYLAAFQISSIIYTGQGKVGAENGHNHVSYQLSQRADFVEILSGFDTMAHRGVVNTRDEPLCADLGKRWNSRPSLARLHVIFFDHTLCQVATLLRAGTLQMVVAMIEAGWVDPRLTLDDPLKALEHWSSDPSLQARSRTTSGDEVTAVQLQTGFLEKAKRFGDAGGFDGIVPRAEELLVLWEDTLIKLRKREFDALGRRLDWVLKRRMLERVMAQRPGLTWASPELKHLDQLYASLDETNGPFWAFERAGQVDRVVGEEAIRHAAEHPPDDTRAWTRAHLLRLADPDEIDRIDWDSVQFRVGTRRDPYWLNQPRIVTLSNPAESTRAMNAALFERNRTLDQITEALGALGGLPSINAADLKTLTYPHH